MGTVSEINNQLYSSLFIWAAFKTFVMLDLKLLGYEGIIEMSYWKIHIMGKV